MALHVEPMLSKRPLAGRAMFLSASIPDPTRWDGSFDVLEITDAVVAACRAVLTAGATLVTAAHPTIAPLLLYVAAEFPRESDSPPTMITYQSRLFENMLPEATHRFIESGVGDVRFTPAEPGEEPIPSKSTRSLRTMREAMFDATQPSAALFVGGMEGIRDEYELLMARRPRPLAYAVGRPGGEASRLVADIDTELRGRLRDGDVYPSLFREVMQDISIRLERTGPDRGF